MKQLRWLILVAGLALVAQGGALAQGPGAAAAPGFNPTAASTQDVADIPWWDNFPLIVLGGAWGSDAPNIGKRFHADAVFCDSADDPSWGTYGQRQRIIEANPAGAAKMRAAG